MVLQLNLTDIKGNKPLLNLLKKLKYIEIREVKKEKEIIDCIYQFVLIFFLWIVVFRYSM